ncbi:MAG: flavodoxin [Lysobacteraceae bacterium SCN 69-123]|uniref:flavodoxin family protein n=1 Tax=Stenotrophomonas acidaminiphila TaxID=128780 RepID=UPI00086CAD4A|nr:NAD(P)H-dependent oxidoreductase [Stenotrophomonas acidaminiphila]MBN8800324.1 NAD(P)H-dependent oxidoreductase [Stenotrophomonas acidaminiphila]MDF9443347.1 flavodoxin family protein [Stenotrophomonas acidaminiphila]ODU44394.1 MAG: flavodoxin [Xanthomonadaceae bacterium SCN 69-123]OJY80704.1 MAG: flavodoxin [Stenotrophomonas sp. 69-14]
MVATPRRLLVVWHGFTGATRAMAEAVAGAARGDAGEALEVCLLRAADAGADDVLGADAVVFATPETLASISGAMKDFFDRSYYPLLGRCDGKPYALVVCAGSDGEPTIAQLRRIATGLRLREVAEPLLVRTHAQTPEAIAARKLLPEADLARGRELGALLAAGLALGIY